MSHGAEIIGTRCQHSEQDYKMNVHCFKCTVSVDNLSLYFIYYSPLLANTQSYKTGFA